MDHASREWAALQLALDLHRDPWGVRLVRKQPLPDGMGLLLAVAAGEDPASETAATARFDRPSKFVREAATFFIEQILLAPGTDSYRVLGANPEASVTELRRNMALLMRWLHPDVARAGDRAVLAQRIAAAWNTLKTPERRAAYDLQRSGAMPDGTHAEGTGARGRTGSGHRAKALRRRKSRLPRLVAFWLLGKSRY